MASRGGAPASNPVLDFLEEVRAELERTRRELKEINLLVDQSRGEVEKLTQRNATIANHLRQIQITFDTVPRSDIKAAYEAAADAQQRLFTMRGQLEKLQGEQASLKRYAEYLQKTLDTLEGAEAIAAGGDGRDTTPPIVRIINAQEAERQRLSKAMHDGPAQSLTNLILQAEIVQRLFDSDPERCRAELGNLKTAASATFQKVRDFITDLRPMMLDDLGLVPTVRRYVDSFNNKSGIPTQITITGAERRLEPYREVIAFRGVQELLANARDHSQASQIRVTLDVDEVRVRVVVEDNGRGFDPAAVFSPTQKTVGLPTLKERVELVGGTIQIDTGPGQGTRVTLEIPAAPVSALT